MADPVKTPPPATTRGGAALYDIELLDEATGQWKKHHGGTLLYCGGWLDCFRETAPASKARVIRRWDGTVVGEHHAD